MLLSSSAKTKGTLAALATLLSLSCSVRSSSDQDQGPIGELSPEPEQSEDEENEDDNTGTDTGEKGEDDQDNEEDQGSQEPDSSDSKDESTEQEPEPEPEKGSRALVIKHGWDIPNAHALPEIEKDIKDSPFDGVVFSAQGTSRIFGSKSVPLRTMRRHLRGLDAIDPNTDSHYYMIMYVDALPGGFLGEGADILIQNARRLGQVLSKTPVKGIAFDNEVYKKNPWRMPDACPGLNRQECGQAAFEVGKQMMAAMMESWPDLHMWAFFGPWLNDHRTYDWIAKYANQNDWAQDDDVTSEFVAGIFAASTQGPALFIDGGEFYGLRTRKDFAQTSQWMRSEMVKESPFFPDDLRDKYAKQMKVGFGIYDDRIHLYTKLPRLDPRRWSDVIFTASKEADMVWIYTEIHDWWKNDGNDWPEVSAKKGTDGHVPEDWSIAARNALVGKPRPLEP